MQTDRFLSGSFLRLRNFGFITGCITGCIIGRSYTGNCFRFGCIIFCRFRCFRFIFFCFLRLNRYRLFFFNIFYHRCHRFFCRIFYRRSRYIFLCFIFFYNFYVRNDPVTGHNFHIFSLGLVIVKCVRCQLLLSRFRLAGIQIYLLLRHHIFLRCRRFLFWSYSTHRLLCSFCRLFFLYPGGFFFCNFFFLCSGNRHIVLGIRVIKRVCFQLLFRCFHLAGIQIHLFLGHHILRSCRRFFRKPGYRQHKSAYGKYSACKSLHQFQHRSVFNLFLLIHMYSSNSVLILS